MKMKPMPRKRGAKKITLSDEDLQKIESLAARGVTNEQIHDCLGFSKDTFYRLMHENAKLSEAIKRGKSKGIATIAGTLFEQAKSGNTTALIFYLKTQARWKETVVNEHTGLNGEPIKHNVEAKLTTDAIAERIAALIDKN